MKALCSGVLLGVLALAAVKDKGKVVPAGGINVPGIQIPFANLKTEAVVGAGATLDAQQDVTVSAVDVMHLFTFAGGLGVSGSGNAGVGIGIDVGRQFGRGGLPPPRAAGEV